MVVSLVRETGRVHFEFIFGLVEKGWHQAIFCSVRNIDEPLTYRTHIQQIFFLFFFFFFLLLILSSSFFRLGPRVATRACCPGLHRRSPCASSALHPRSRTSSALHPGPRTGWPGLRSPESARSTLLAPVRQPCSHESPAGVAPVRDEAGHSSRGAGGGTRAGHPLSSPFSPASCGGLRGGVLIRTATCEAAALAPVGFLRLQAPPSVVLLPPILSRMPSVSERTFSPSSSPPARSSHLG